jgi:hypothetical protein
MHQVISKRKRYLDVAFIAEINSVAQLQVRGRVKLSLWSFWLIAVDQIVIVKYRTAIKELLIYLNLCLSVMLNSLSC